MAVAAFDVGMPARQFVTSQVVVKRRLVPSVGGVAAVALLAETALMRIVLCVAVVAAGRRIAVRITVRMTIAAGGTQV